MTHTVERPPPGEGVPIHYTFDEGQGTTAANSGNDPSVGAATLSGAAGWTPAGRFGSALSLPGGASGTGNQVRLPDNIQAGMDEEFTVSLWARPDALPNWVPLLQIGSSTDTFFLLQSSTQAAGATGFAATFKAPGNPTQERLTLGGGNDLPLNAWTHVVFTMSGSTGKIYFDGELQATRTDFNLGIGDVGVDGVTTANLIGGTSWPDARFDGLVDDFQMYAYELSADEVTELFEGPNAAPVGAADAYGTEEDTPLTVDAPGVLANDTDADSDDLTATAATQPANGEVVLETDGSFTYTPDAGFAGTDTFTYRADDGTATSAATTVTLTVEEGDQGPVNTAPVAVDDAYTTVEEQPLVLPAPGVLANDTDADGDVLTAIRLGQPLNGTVSLASDGSFSYTPDAGFSGRDVFTYSADDGEDTSAPARVTITVEAEDGGLATTAVAGVALPTTYGKAGTVSVAIAPTEATGTVEVVQGSTVLATATVADGRATLVLPAKVLLPGTYDLTLRYGGDAAHQPSSSTVEVVVEKVVPSMVVTATKVAGNKARITVQLSAADDVPVTGEVRVWIEGGAMLVGTVSDGRAVFEWPKIPKGGQLTLTAAYLGSDLVQAVSADLTVKVRN